LENLEGAATVMRLSAFSDWPAALSAMRLKLVTERISFLSKCVAGI